LPKGNPANLVQNAPEGRFTPEQRRAWAVKAGTARGEQLKRQKTLRELYRSAMALDVQDPETAEQLESLGLKPTYANAIVLSSLLKAGRGDIEAARFVRDTIGEKPTETMNLGVSNTPVKALDMTKLSDAELEALADRSDEDD
jgi:hypothetical protein